MRLLLLLFVFFPLVSSFGWVDLMESEDPDEAVFKNVFGDDEDTLDLIRPIKPIQRASNFIRRFIDDSSDEEDRKPRIVQPSRAFSSNSLPESVSSVDSSSKHSSPATLFLDTAENLFSHMFSLLKPEQVTWHVVRPDDEDIKGSVLDDDRSESSGETPLVVTNDGNGEKASSAELAAIDRISSFFDKIGSSAVSSTSLTGPHICVRELHKKIEPSSKRSSFRECKRFEKALRCVEKQTSKKGGTETTRIQECCDGFDTDDISANGCDREIVLMSTRETLTLANSTIVELFDTVGLSDILDGPERRTIVVPPNAAIERMKESGDDQSIRNQLLNLVMEGDLRDYEMEDGNEMKTLANASMVVNEKEDGRRQKTLLNCVPLISTNLRTSSGLLHYSSNAIALSSSNIIDYLESTDRFKTFVSLITPDIERKLRSPDSRYTVFAFSDQAFGALSERVRANIMSKSACVKDLIINHIVNGALCSTDLEDRTVISMGGHVLRVQSMVNSSGSHLIRIGTAKITEPDRFASNGVVHVIDDVILLENLLTWRDHLLTFNEPLLNALSDMSMDAEPITIFVPPQNASTGSLDMDVFAMNHVVEKSLITSPVEKTQITTLTNSSFFLGVYKPRSPISIHLNTGYGDYRSRPRIGCSRIVNQSIHACNSVLHFIDKPLPIVDGNIDDLLSTREDLSRFHSLWKKSDIADLLTGTDPITVFAPSDDAMSRNQYNAMLKNVTLLNTFVRRYIVKGPLCSFDLRAKVNEIKYDLIPNEAGEVLRPGMEGDELYIEGSKVQEEEILTSNGVVYVLETPIHKSPSSMGSRILPLSFADILGLTPRLLAAAT